MLVVVLLLLLVVVVLLLLVVAAIAMVSNSSQAYKLSGGGGNFVLSTSNVGYTALFGGFAPVRCLLLRIAPPSTSRMVLHLNLNTWSQMVRDGYGVCYSLLEGRLNVTVTAWRSNESTSAESMRDALHDALVRMMRTVVDAAGDAAQSKL